MALHAICRLYFLLQNAPRSESPLRATIMTSEKILNIWELNKWKKTNCRRFVVI